jgi:hypothetical protein
MHQCVEGLNKTFQGMWTLFLSQYNSLLLTRCRVPRHHPRASARERQPLLPKVPVVGRRARSLEGRRGRWGAINHG